MAALSTYCPNCDRKLKLPGPEAIGKKATCPGCRERIVVPAPSKRARTEGDAPRRAAAAAGKSRAASSGQVSQEAIADVQASDAGSRASPVAAKLVEAPFGLEARWVPDAPSTPERPSSTAAAQPDDPLISTAEETDSEPVAETGLDFLTVRSNDESTDRAESTGDESHNSEEVIATLAAKRLREKRLRRAVTAVSGLALLAALGFFLVPRLQSSAKTPVSSYAAVAADDPVPESRREPIVAITSPTRGEPIPTELFPDGVSLVLRVRVADLKRSSNAAVLESLPPGLIQALDDWIESEAGEQPSNIESLTLACVMAGRGSRPQVTGIVRLLEPFDLGRRLQRLGGTVTTLGDGQRRIDRSTHTVIIRDNQTFAVTPKAAAEEVVASIDSPNQFVNSSITNLLRLTDRQRLVTAVASRNDLAIHGPTLLGDAGSDLLESAIVLFGDRFDGIVASWHQGRDSYLEVLGDPGTGTTSSIAEQDLRKRWDDFPTKLMDRLRRTTPVGPTRQYVSRVPAMAEAARQCSEIDAPDGFVRLRISLPPQAAANIAMGTLLTYNVLHVGPGPSTVASATPARQEPLTVRLERSVEASFSRVPLQEALAFLADEANATIEIDGDALKSAGYTKNLAQQFDMGRVSIRRTLAKIVSQYPGMVVAVDESTNQLIVTTESFAKNQGLEPLDLPAPNDD